MRKLLLLLLLLPAACAAPAKHDRYVSAEDDAIFREMCAPAGCVVLPAPMFEDMLRHLGQEI